MTAEIAVANKLGIAIAADSAVTVEQLHKNQLQRKVYNSANKIFTLSKWHPVGIMIYNTATLGGTPWETIIKTYRQQLHKDKFNTIAEHSADFFEKITARKYLFPEDSVKDIVMFNAYRILLKIAKQSNAAAFRAALDAEITRIEALEYLDGFDAIFEKIVGKTYRQEIDQAAGIALKSSFKHSNKIKIEKLISLSFTKKELLSGYSGIVICGFGDEEVFPSLVEYQSDIVVCGKIRYWQKEKYNIGRKTRSFVVPFADTAVIRTMIDGINPSFAEKQYLEAIKVIASMPREILNQVSQLTQVQKDAYIAAATPSVVSAFRKFADQMQKYRLTEYVEPIEQTIEILPISDLANVAETFLSASHIHKRVTPSVESVGGPVDVATISKGDGFVWIKRKHYFEEKLNKSYAQKYLEENK